MAGRAVLVDDGNFIAFEQNVVVLLHARGVGPVRAEAPSFVDLICSASLEKQSGSLACDLVGGLEEDRRGGVLGRFVHRVLLYN